MRISCEWLRRYAHFETSPEELADRLTFLGLNVEEVSPVLPHSLEGVVMARILEVDQIDDDLMLCQVDAGSAGQFRVVSGAPNTRPGIHAPLAVPGAELPDGTLIEALSLRGVNSQGMLCSARELGLELGSPDYLLEVEEARPGAPARSELGLDDLVFELDLTPNYAVHCQSVLGVVREVQAALGCPVASPPEEVTPGCDAPDITDLVSISVADPDLCPRYTATLATGIQVAPSSWWMQRDLIASGIRPINNVVDATNHVMLEYGQPLHAFDLDLVQGGEVIVRRARPGERIITLDGKDRILEGGDLVIADGVRAIGIAGVMGGANSEITENTRRVLLESAYFEPRAILRTSRRLGLRTQASLRFEKGRDPEGTAGPTLRALRWIQKMGAGQPAAGMIDVYPERIPRRIITFRPEQVNRLLGTDLDEREMYSYLERFGFAVEGDGGSAQVLVPSWRADVEAEVGLIEEIARLHGYNNIPAAKPLTPVSGYRPPPVERLSERVRRFLVGAGFYETVNYSWMSQGVLDLLGTPEDHPHRQAVEVANPMREEQRYLRTTLLGSLLPVLGRNVARDEEQRGFRLFEIGGIYRSEELPPRGLLDEVDCVGLVMAGPRSPRFWAETDASELDFYDFKGIMEGMLEVLHVDEWSVSPAEAYFLHPGRAAELSIAGERVGVFGQLHPEAAARLELESRTYVGEFRIQPLVATGELAPRTRRLPAYPASVRDIALVVEDRVTHVEVERIIEEAAADLLDSVRLFDVYRGGQVAEGKKSMAYSLTYRSADRTLTDAEVEQCHGRVRDALVRTLGAALRS